MNAARPNSAPPVKGVDPAREAAAAALSRVLDDGAWAAPALSSVLDASAMGERDKAFATELFYGALRFARPLETSVLRGADKPGRGLDVRIRPHLIIAAYQLQHLQERVPAHAAVDAAVSAVKRVRPGLDGFANALLRKLGSPLHALLKADAPLTDIAEAWGVPLPLAEAITARLPTSEHAAAVAGLSARPTTYATSGHPFDADLQQRLAAAPSETKHAFVPGVVEASAGKVSDLPGFKDGAFLVADPGSVLCALAVGAGPGQRVLDLCAAPGTKSVLLRNAGADVTAVELNPKRARRISDNARRMNVTDHLKVVVDDATTLPIDEMDAVLLDAPCTGLGTTRRKPEIKLRRNDDDVRENSKLQAKLLQAAARQVKPGGVLVYSVCSPLPQEGAQQIEAFLHGHPDFAREDLRAVLPFLPASAVDDDGQVRLLPHLHDADAFFIARLRRAATATPVSPAVGKTPG